MIRNAVIKVGEADVKVCYTNKVLCEDLLGLMDKVAQDMYYFDGSAYGVRYPVSVVYMVGIGEFDDYWAVYPSVLRQSGFSAMVYAFDTQEDKELFDKGFAENPGIALDYKIKINSKSSKNEDYE